MKVGTVYGHYELLDELGRGGTAVVWRVRHVSLGSLHALKVLSWHGEVNQRRLMLEGKAQARLRHPNLLPVTDTVEIEGQIGLIMEYVDGPSLATALASMRFSVTEADALARQILTGVAAAHSAGVIHRDLKPGNILLAVSAGELYARVADFGLARLLQPESDPRTHSGIGMGTPAYMAAEQARDASRADARSDVFSLGIVLYELLTGRHPFGAGNAMEMMIRIAQGAYLPLPDVGLPIRMVETIHVALSPDPGARPADAGAMLASWTDGTPAPSWEPDRIAEILAFRPTLPPSKGSVSPPSASPWPSVPAPSSATTSQQSAPSSPSTAAGGGRQALLLSLLVFAVVVSVSAAGLLFGSTSPPTAPPPASTLDTWLAGREQPLLVGLAPIVSVGVLSTTAGALDLRVRGLLEGHSRLRLVALDVPDVPISPTAPRSADIDGYVDVGERAGVDLVLVVVAGAYGDIDMLNLVRLDVAARQVGAHSYLEGQPEAINAQLPTALEAILMSEPATSQTLDQRIKDVTSGGSAKVRQCYEAALSTDPTLGGRLVLALTISASGRVRDLRFDEDQLATNEAFRTCVLGAFANILFPAGDELDLYLPFIFSTGP